MVGPARGHGERLAGAPLRRRRPGARTLAVGGPFVALALAALAGPARAAAIDGTWLTENGLSRVRIAPCGGAGARCATIAWTAREARDARNPDPALRERRLAGIRIASDARPDGDRWAGRLYNPEDGRTYQGTLRALGPRTLRLTGCVLAGLICRSQTWTRVD